MEVSKLRETLRKYGALDNDYRLKAFLEIYRNPGISFNEIARKLKVERSLLAYHLDVLKAAGLIALSVERESKTTSHYTLTKEGENLLQEILKKQASSNPVKDYRLR